MSGYNSTPVSSLLSKRPLEGLRNILVFGESGVGKSSIVNMLADDPVAKVNDGATGTTLSSEGYAILCRDHKLNLYDTLGLNESKCGAVPAKQAMQSLFFLIRSLAVPPGIALILFVTRYRITETVVKNYNLLRAIFGDDGPPVVVVIPWRDDETDNEEWWEKEKRHFLKNKMRFAGHVIGCANPKRKHSPESGYDEMLRGLHNAIATHCASRDTYTMPELRWFEIAVIRMFGKFGGLRKRFDLSKDDIQQMYEDTLTQDHTISPERARASSRRVRNGLGNVPSVNFERTE